MPSRSIELYIAVAPRALTCGATDSLMNSFACRSRRERIIWFSFLSASRHNVSSRNPAAKENPMRRPLLAIFRRDLSVIHFFWYGYRIDGSLTCLASTWTVGPIGAVLGSDELLGGIRGGWDESRPDGVWVVESVNFLDLGEKGSVVLDCSGLDLR